MSEHIYNKEELVERFDAILNKTFEEIDDKDIFQHLLTNQIKLQKGIAGTIIEQCILNYPPDTKQKPDLTIIDGEQSIPTELKVTGMSMDKKGGHRFVAKEPISITAVGVYTLAEQTFETSHFWAKLEHLLLVYYLYDSKKSVTPYQYKNFHIKGYEFHEFNDSDEETLRQDWTYVHDLVKSVVDNHTDIIEDDKKWKKVVKKEYIDKHTILREVLSYIDLAPTFPPRFRLKKPVVNAIIANHFGYSLEQLPGRYTTVSAIDQKCKELEQLYKGKTIIELSELFNLSLLHENKAISEQITIRMFGGKSNKLNQIELFSRFGLIAKSIVITKKGSRTEDMKLFHINFDEMMTETIVDDTGETRSFQFEDSELYMYFADHEFLCIIYEEPEKEYVTEGGKRVEQKHSLSLNKFVGFKRLVFSDEFIQTTVRKVWEDTRYKIKNNLLKDVPNLYKDGTPIINCDGEISSAPNFIKSSENTVFIRGGGIDSSLKHKTECVNGIKMLPQFIWIKGKAICDMIKD